MSGFKTDARGRGWRWSTSGLSVALAASLSLAAGVTTAQPKPSPRDKAANAVPAAAGQAPAPTGALPPGHPPVDDDENGGPSANAQPDVPGMFNPPPNGATDDASLPVGTIVVSVRDAEDKPIPRAPLTVTVLRNTVAKGEAPPENRTSTTDEQGGFRYDNLPVGAGASFRVTTQRGSAKYEAPPFSLSDKVGKRVVVHAYEVTSNIDRTKVGIQGVVYLQLREDSLNVQQYFGVLNMGSVAWAPEDAVVALPEGFRAFNKQDTTDEGRVEEAADKGVAFRGTFGPGQHELDFHYTVPLAGTERQTLRFQLPPHFAHMRVMVEASKQMGLEVPGFPDAQRQTGRDGKKLLITERQAARADGGLTSIEVTLSGLPTQGPGRWISVMLGLAFVAAGVGYVVKRRGTPGALDDDTRRDLRDAQGALLDEIVALERAHRSGEVGPKTYARVRGALLDALARIVTMVGTTAEKKPVRPRGGRGAASSRA